MKYNDFVSCSGSFGQCYSRALGYNFICLSYLPNIEIIEMNLITLNHIYFNKFQSIPEKRNRFKSLTLFLPKIILSFDTHLLESVLILYWRYTTQLLYHDVSSMGKFIFGNYNKSFGIPPDLITWHKTIESRLDKVLYRQYYYLS